MVVTGEVEKNPSGGYILPADSLAGAQLVSIEMSVVSEYWNAQSDQSDQKNQYLFHTSPNKSVCAILILVSACQVKNWSVFGVGCQREILLDIDAPQQK